MSFAVNDVLTDLAARISDTDGDQFSTAVQLDALNDAQDDLLSLLEPVYLNEIQYTKTNVTATDGLLEITAGNLTNVPFGGAGGILLIQETNTLEYFRGPLTENHIKVWYENFYLTGQTYDRAWYPQDNYIKLLPASTIAINVNLLKVPTVLAAGQNCDLNAALRNLLLLLAEAECWRQDEELDRAQAAHGKALAKIELMNKRAKGL